MARNDPEFVKPYFYPNPWHQIPGILRETEVGSFLFFAGPKSVFVPVAYVADLGNLGAFVADMQTNGLPADVNKGRRYVNMYDLVWMPDDM
jgi:hypothetical protein